MKAYLKVAIQISLSFPWNSQLSFVLLKTSFQSIPEKLIRVISEKLCNLQS